VSVADRGVGLNRVQLTSDIAPHVVCSHTSWSLQSTAILKQRSYHWSRLASGTATEERQRHQDTAQKLAAAEILVREVRLSCHRALLPGLRGGGDTTQTNDLTYNGTYSSTAY